MWARQPSARTCASGRGPLPGAGFRGWYRKHLAERMLRCTAELAICSSVHRSASREAPDWIRVPESWPRPPSQLCAPFLVRGAMVEKLLLVVDDDEDNRTIFSTVLSHSGYNVLLATHGEEGLEQAKHHAPDLILMDLQMPVMSGWDATRLLKADPLTASIPIIAVTAEDHSPTRYQDGGFCACVRKPVEPRDLVEAIAFCLEEGSREKLWIDLSSIGAPLRDTVTAGPLVRASPPPVAAPPLAGFSPARRGRGADR